ncbi:MAG: radical SAM family heme chaperone HemW [Flavobacteriales bacterium]|nr:radical SAM family heme chaperone HemW [Flavobacteriales bacterium]
MAGLYIHIPFCLQRCHYCDFHFSTDMRYVDRMVDALVTELKNKASDWKQYTFQTLYFGGGTPSILEAEHLKDLLSAIHSEFSLESDLEVTLEANPEDMHPHKLKLWSEMGVNRLSIGIQSLDDSSLAGMNRAHTVEQAIEAIRAARTAGFDNISLDLIFGRPESTISSVQNDLDGLLAFRPEHISAYALTIESKTYFSHLERKGLLKPMESHEVAEQFVMIGRVLEDHGYERYEVSNYARPDFESRHNSSYWSGEPYLGIGPSAHSFDGERRSWNVRSNHQYMRSMETDLDYAQSEELDVKTRFNEYVMTRSRTKWGLDLDYARTAFGVDIEQRFEKELTIYHGKYRILDGHLILNEEGLLMADRFSSDLFLIDEE